MTVGDESEQKIAGTHLLDNAVPFLQLETTRAAEMRRELYQRSAAFDDSKKRRAELAETLRALGDSHSGKPALSVQEEDAMAQELGAAAVDEARAERSYDDVLQQLPGQQMVLTKLRSLLSQKLRLSEAVLQHQVARDAVANAEKVVSRVTAASVAAVTAAVKPENNDPPVVVLPPSIPAVEAPEGKEDELEAASRVPPQLSDVKDLLKASSDIMMQEFASPMISLLEVMISETEEEEVEEGQATIAQSMPEVATGGAGDFGATGLGEPERSPTPKPIVEGHSAYTAFGEPAIMTNEKALERGELDSLYIPELNHVSPEDALDVAAGSASHANMLVKQSTPATEKTRRAANLAERRHRRLRHAHAKAADRYDIAAHRAKAAAERIALPTGGATGIAWDAMGLPGDAPEIWMRGNPYEDRTTHVITDVMEMGPLDATGAAGHGSAGDEDDLDEEFGTFGPTGPHANRLMRHIAETRHHQELQATQAHLLKLEAERELRSKEAEGGLWEDSTETYAVAALEHKQQSATHERKTWWAEENRDRHEDAMDWDLANEEADDEQDKQDMIDLEAAEIDDKNADIAAANARKRDVAQNVP